MFLDRGSSVNNKFAQQSNTLKEIIEGGKKKIELITRKKNYTKIVLQGTKKNKLDFDCCLFVERLLMY